MSQRRKGPGGPRAPAAQLLPCPCSIPHPQNQGCPSTFSPKHEIFLRLQGTALGPVLVSALPFSLSYLPAFIPEA